MEFMRRREKGKLQEHKKATRNGILIFMEGSQLPTKGVDLKVCFELKFCYTHFGIFVNGFYIILLKLITKCNSTILQ